MYPNLYRSLPATYRQLVRADQLVPERADPVDDRPDHLRRVVPHLDVPRPERVDIPQAPDQLCCAADDPTRKPACRSEGFLAFSCPGYLDPQPFC